MAKSYYNQAIRLLIANKGKRSGLPVGYGGNNDPSLCIKIPILKMIAKDFLAVNKTISDGEFEMLLDRLYSGRYDDEKCFASKLLSLNHQYRRKINPRKLDRWLNTLYGWSQVDSLCQSTFSAKEILTNWPEWEKVIRKFSTDKNINKRRASLVLLIRSLRESGDSKLRKIAFENIDKLKLEKDILITKAISWILREMVKLHKDKIANYLNKNSKSLPRIALRETRRKLETGRKS
jgi:3-methyladenine DNA glycosylase AlkD